MAGNEIGDRPRLEAVRQVAAHVEEPLELGRQRLAPGQQADRLERCRGLVGEDRQEAQVLIVELVQPQL